ncbi:MAG TPA: BlaI/MecI/CopY family transcriptional regulator [Thermoleophilaceae bacterium]|nr:BlaI/MecI/CopY family transcriptional regulator [Thermoleophilaceae bacterium]
MDDLQATRRHDVTGSGSRREAGELESEVLAALWASSEPMTPAAVLEQLGDELAYTTVMTTLARLFEKGVVDRQRVGRGYAYSPKVGEAELAARRFRAALDRGHDRGAVLQGFVSELTRDEQRMLLELLESGRRAPRRGRGT